MCEIYKDVSLSFTLATYKQAYKLVKKLVAIDISDNKTSSAIVIQQGFFCKEKMQVFMVKKNL